MAVKRVMLEDFDEAAYFLCAIHSSLPSYKMAYLLNKYLSLKLERANKDIQVVTSKETQLYPCYIFEDDLSYTNFTLFKNKCLLEQTFDPRIPSELFSETATQTSVTNLVPECRNVDYFLKIETENLGYSPKILVSKIAAINHVITAFILDHSKIKSRTNLIII